MDEERQIEIERKYDVGSSQLIPDLIGVGAIAASDPSETVELLAVYFDTGTLSLARNHIALRRRGGGSDEGWHIKLPGDEGRTELHWSLSRDNDEDAGGRDTVPAVVREAIGHLIGDELLVPVARVANRRIITVLRDAAGAPLAELCDDHVEAENLRADRGTAPAAASWREWEVELMAGAPDTRDGRAAFLDRVEQELLEAGAAVSSSPSKLARALGLTG